MKKEDCKIGTEVYTCDGLNYRYIIKSLPNNENIVEVDSVDFDTNQYSFHIEDLFIYDKENINKIAIEYQSKIDDAKNALEKAFEVINSLRDCHEAPSFAEAGLISTKELELVMDNGGWSSSSLWC